MLDGMLGPTYAPHMPYTNETAGIYQIRNTRTGEYYVGSTKRMRKRTAEHMRLLRLGQHPNPNLQTAYDAEPHCFKPFLEVVCEDVSDLEWLEEEFLTGNAWFGEACKLYNISVTAKTPMKYRKHSEATKNKISLTKKGCTAHVTAEYKAKLSALRQQKALADPKYLAKIKFLVENDHMTYAARGREVGLDTSSARKLALKYSHLKGEI